MLRPPPKSTLFPYPTLFRSHVEHRDTAAGLQHESHGTPVTARPMRDETLQHPRCVYQVLKRHYARYTPEVVERSEEHTSELQSRQYLVCRLLLEKKKKYNDI